MSWIAIEEKSSTVTSNQAMIRLKHKWTIKDFTANHLVKSPAKDSYPLPLYSALFSSSQDKGTQFRMRLMPRGETDTGKNSLSLSMNVFHNPPIAYTEYPNSPNVYYKFCLLNDRNEKCHSKALSKTTLDSSGYFNFLEHAILLDPANRLLPADHLTILAEVDVYSEPVGQFGNEFLLAKRIWEAKENLTKSLGTLMDNEDDSDVVLVPKKYEDDDEEEEYAAHKNILSLYSPVLNAMFKSEMVEGEESGRIQFPDMVNYVVHKMLEFIYKGCVEDFEDYVEELYEAADKYGIIRLKELCCQYLCDNVVTENANYAASMLVFADRHSVDQLKKTCVKFLRAQKLEDVLLTVDWLLIHKVFIEELRLLKLKEEEEEKKVKTPEEPQGSNQPASPKYRLRHKWIIQKFASTYLERSLDKPRYPKICSVWFSSVLDRQIQFRLHLKPRGEGEKNKNVVSLYIEVKRHSWPVMVKSTEVCFKISFLNERNEKCHSQEVRREFQHPAPMFGFPNFLNHTRLLDPVNGLLPADQLTILAEVVVLPNKLESELPFGRIEWAARENVSSSLGTLLDSGDYSDIVLVVKGQKLAAHKNILSAQSPVFSAMFKSEMVEREEGRVLIQDMEVDVAKVFLRFIYTGDVEDLEKYAQELLMAADKYGITRLKALCSQYLCGRLDTDNVAAMFALADRHSVEQLKKTCVKYIIDHWQEVIISKDWPLIDKLFIEELTQLKQKKKEKITVFEESESFA